MRRWIGSVLLLLSCTGAICADAPRTAESKPPDPRAGAFDRRPIYDPAEQLEDGLAMAALVVEGTPAAANARRTLQVEAVLFGKVATGMRNDDDSLKLGIVPRVAAGQRGIWLLVPSPSGYCSVNPTVAPLSRAEFAAIRRHPRHWTDQPELATNTAYGHQMYHSYQNAADKTVWHGPNVTTNNGELSVFLMRHGRRVLWVRWDRAGRLERSYRQSADGHGTFVAFHDGRLMEFRHDRNRKSHGLYRRWYRDAPDQLREERHFDNGVIHGRERLWNEDGSLKRDVTYDQGMIPPICRYTGGEASGIFVRRHDSGVSYFGRSIAVDQVKIGMTVAEVVQLLKVDVSPQSGVHFPTWLIDAYLHIAFDAGKVGKISTGHNGVCVEFVPE